jgi:hypothetical protein
MSNAYKCQTNQGYSNCNLGQFFGVKASKPSTLFNINWETTNYIQLDKTNGQYELQFYIFYNCYQKKSFVDFFGSDCNDVLDRLFIYRKTSPSDFYSPIGLLDLDKSKNENKWSLYTVKVNATQTNTLWFKFKFERINGASKGEAIFGLDSLSLIGMH